MNLSDDKQSPLGRNAGAVPVWGPACAAPAHPLAVGAVGFGPAWQDDDDGWVQLTEKGRQTVADNMAASIVRLEQELEEANARVAVLEEEQKILAKGCKSCGVAWAEHLGIAGTCEALRQALEERDEARAQYRTTELLGMALVKTIDELKEDLQMARKIADSAMWEADRLRPRQGASIYEIAESVREKYDPEYEGEGMDNG